MAFDQRFKELLRTFFLDFLELFLPEMAAHVDPDSITPRDPETFTDVPEGQRRIADLVMEVRSRDGAVEYVLIHVEIQGQRQEAFGLRMWQYNVLLRMRGGPPTISIAVMLYPGTGGVSLERYSETHLGHEYPMLDYWQIGLRDLAAEEYLHARPDLAVGLAALMRPGEGGRVALKRALLQRLAASTLDEARVFLLWDTVEAYLPLSDEEEAALREQMRAEGDDAVEATELSWTEKILQRGVERGIAQGIEQGAIAAKRADIGTLVRARFGDLPTEIERRIATADQETLNRLLVRVVRAGSIEEFIAAP
jgi:hypothetical protein